MMGSGGSVGAAASDDFVYVCVRRAEKPHQLMEHARKTTVKDAQENRLKNPLLTTTVLNRYLDPLSAAKSLPPTIVLFFHKKMI